MIDNCFEGPQKPIKTMSTIIEHVFPGKMEGPLSFSFPKGLYGHVDVLALDDNWNVHPVDHIITRGPGDDSEDLPITRIECAPIVGIPAPVTVRVVWA